MRAWIARDKCEVIWGYMSKPYKDKATWIPTSADYFRVEKVFLPEGINPQWSDDEPIEVELKIERV